jgi:hypothetical protein
MDLIDRLKDWEELSPLHTITDEQTEEAYWIYFMKGKERMGYVKTVSGSMSWEYPKELVSKEA